MKILYYERNEWIDEGRLLDPLIQLGLNAESLLPELSGFPLFKGSEFDLKDLSQAGGYGSDDQSVDPERISFNQIQEYLQLAAPKGKFSTQTGKIIDLLIKASEAVARVRDDGRYPPTGISANSLKALLAYTYGLDQLNIGSVFTPALPLPAGQPQNRKLVEAIYEICQVKVSPAKNDGASISWVAAAMLAVLAEFQVPPFRFLQTINSPVGPGGDELQALQVVVGELDIAEDKTIVLIQTNIDDMSSQLLSYVINRLFEAGALDVYQVPVYMKKNRLGIRLNVVVRQQDEARLANLILRETTTLGVNVRPLHHNYHAEVRMVEVETKYGIIPVKQKYLDGVLIQSKPEYEVMAKITTESRVSMDELHNEIAEQLKLKNRGTR
jgi:hypothetical protein